MPMTMQYVSDLGGRPSAPAVFAAADAVPGETPHYYPSPSKPLAERTRSAEPPPSGQSTATMLHNVVTLTASHAGMGLSVMASMLAWSMARRGYDCALMDADFVAGGLDLLLGIENEPGLRFSQIDAPMGHVEGEVLNHELMRWEGVRVLPYDPWGSRQPDWWEVQAVVRALAEVNDVVIVDAGQGGLIETTPDIRHATQIMAIELSVMGLARAKAHRARLASWQCEDPYLVAIEPRGAPRGRGAVSIVEACDYLAARVAGPIKSNVTLCGDVLEGLGIRTIARSSRATINRLADHVESMVPRGGSRREGE